MRVVVSILTNKIPIITTMTAAKAAADAILGLKDGEWTVKPLQEYYGAS
jgi:hypothetical protein